MQSHFRLRKVNRTKTISTSHLGINTNSNNNQHTTRIITIHKIPQHNNNNNTIHNRIISNEQFNSSACILETIGDHGSVSAKPYPFMITLKRLTTAMAQALP